MSVLLTGEPPFGELGDDSIKTELTVYFILHSTGANPMGRDLDVEPAELWAAVETFEEARPVVRLIAVVLYAHGVSAPTIADWFAVRPATVYSWLDRLERDDSLAQAMEDDRRPGRPRELKESAREEFVRLLAAPPTDIGYEAAEWSPHLARDVLADRFGVEYSLRHARRLLAEAHKQGNREP